MQRRGLGPSEQLALAERHEAAARRGGQRQGLGFGPSQAPTGGPSVGSLGSSDHLRAKRDGYSAGLAAGTSVVGLARFGAFRPPQAAPAAAEGGTSTSRIKASGADAPGDGAELRHLRAMTACLSTTLPPVSTSAGGTRTGTTGEKRGGKSAPKRARDLLSKREAAGQFEDSSDDEDDVAPGNGGGEAPRAAPSLKVVGTASPRGAGGPRILTSRLLGRAAAWSEARPGDIVLALVPPGSGRWQNCKVTSVTHGGHPNVELAVRTMQGGALFSALTRLDVAAVKDGDAEGLMRVLLASHKPAATHGRRLSCGSHQASLEEVSAAVLGPAPRTRAGDRGAAASQPAPLPKVCQAAVLGEAWGRAVARPAAASAAGGPVVVAPVKPAAGSRSSWRERVRKRARSPGAG